MGFISDLISGITSGVDKIGGATGSSNSAPASSDAEEAVNFLEQWSGWFVTFINLIRDFIDDMKGYFS